MIHSRLATNRAAIKVALMSGSAIQTVSTLLLTACGALSIACSAAEDVQRTSQPVVFGADDRQDPFTLGAEPNLLAQSDLVVLHGGVVANSDGTTSTIQSPGTNGSLNNLCSDQRFLSQPIPGSCTAFLVAPDLAATAAHCIQGNNIFVFHFKMEDATNARLTVKNSDVYHSIRTVDFVNDPSGSGQDWAIVQLDRQVSNHRVAQLRHSGQVSLGDAVSMLGHPFGLPYKYANSATVLTNSHPVVFGANLDEFGGNSGSPVYSAVTRSVEGMLTGGQRPELVPDPVSGCNRVRVCPQNGCGGDVNNGAYINRASAFNGGVNAQTATFFVDVTGGAPKRADLVRANWEGLLVRTSNGSAFSSSESNWTGGQFLGVSGNFMADVNGDGRVDAIVVNDFGVTVRRSNGSGFLPNDPNWITGPFYGQYGNFFADVNGDGKADAIVVNDFGITVRLSNGSSFGPNEPWEIGSFTGRYGNYFADVNGDNTADAIAVSDSGVIVRLSFGSGFGIPTNWISSAYLGKYGNYFADVTGDGRADAIVVNDFGVTVRRSNAPLSLDFGPNEPWINERYVGQYGNYFADVTGDNKADAIVINDFGSNAVTVRAANAGATGFNPNAPWAPEPGYGTLGVFPSALR